MAQHKQQLAIMRRFLTDEFAERFLLSDGRRWRSTLEALIQTHGPNRVLTAQYAAWYTQPRRFRHDFVMTLINEIRAALSQVQ